MSELSVGTLSGLAANGYVIDVASGSRLVQPGMIVAVKDAIFTGTQSAALAASASVAVTDLSITHACSDASNKLIISAFLGAAASTMGGAGVAMAIDDGSGFIAVGPAPGSRVSITAGGRVGSDLSVNHLSNSVTFVHTPGDTTSRTYTVHAINTAGAETIFINRTEDDTDNVARVRAVSGFVIQEVSV